MINPEIDTCTTCGGTPELRKRYRLYSIEGYFVICPGCSLKSGEYTNEYTAIISWNIQNNIEVEYTIQVTYYRNVKSITSKTTIKVTVKDKNEIKDKILKSYPNILNYNILEVNNES